MNKFFTKIATISVGLLMAIGVGVGIASGSKEATSVHAAETTYTMTIDSSANGSNNVHWTGSSVTSLTYSNVTWTTSVTGTTNFTASTTYAQVGSKNNPATRVVISTTAFAGKKIVSASLTGFCMSNTGPALTITAGETTMLNSASLVKTTSTTYNSTTNNVTIGNNAAVTFTINSSAKAAICISQIQVVYDDGQSGGGTTTKTLESISIKTAPKTTYTEGEFFDPTGLVITATYSDNSTEDVSYADHSNYFTFSPTTSTALAIDDEVVTITYGGKSTTQAIEVTAAVPDEWITAITAAGTNADSGFKINNINAIKMGTSGNSGTMTITVPSGATKLKLYAVAWNNRGGSSYPVTFSGATVKPSTFNPVANSNITGSVKSFTISDVSDYLVEVSLSNISTETVITLTTTERVIVWSVEYSTVVSQDPDFELDPVNLTLEVGGSSASIEVTVNEYLPDPIYSWAIKVGSDDCVTLTDTSSDTVTVAPKGNALEASATLVITVTSSTDNTIEISKEVPVSVRKISSADNPYTVAQARSAIDGGFGKTDAYVQGIISQIDSFADNLITYWISDNGTTTNQFEVYKGKGLNGANFSAATDLLVGQHVTVKGNLTLYNTTYEFSSGSSIHAFGTHTVTYTLNGGEMSGDNPQTVSSGVYFTLPIPTRSGYVFDGWKKGDDDPIKGNTRVVSDTTYSAQWILATKTLSSITIDTTNCTVDFTKGDTFSSAGLVVTAHYSEGEQYNEVLDEKDYTITSPDMSTIGDKTITIEYTEAGKSDSKTYTIHVHGVVSSVTTTMPASLKLNLGDSSDTYTATITKDSDVEAVVVWKSSDTSIASVSNGVITAASNKTGTASIVAFADVNANGVLDEGEISSTACSVTVIDPTDTDVGTYVLVKDASKLAANDRIVILDKDDDYIMGSQNSTKFRNAIDASSFFAGSNIEIDENNTTAKVIKLSKVGDYYEFLTDTGYLYANSSGSNYINTQETNDANGQWSISIDSSTGNATVVANSSNRNHLRYNYNNGTDPRFSCYQSTSDLPLIHIYKKTTIVDPTTVTLSEHSATIENGQSLTLTYTSDSESASFTWLSSNTAVATVDGGVVECLSNSGTATITIFFDKNGNGEKDSSETVYDTCTITATAPTIDFGSANFGGIGTLIESTANLDGKKVIFGRNGVPAVSGSLSGSYLTAINDNSEIGGVSYDSTTKKMTVGNGRIETGVTVFVITAVTGGYTFSTTIDNETKYLTETSAKSISLSDSEEVWTIEISEGTATITSNGGNALQYNSGSPRFTTYSSSQASIELYEFKSYYEEATEYAEYFLGGDDGTCAETISDWEDLAEMFEGLSEGAQNVYKIATHDSPTSYSHEITVEHAVARYDDALQKNPELRNNEFMGRVEEGSLSFGSSKIISILNISENGNGVAIIVVISMVSLLSLGGYFYLKKRKED